VRGRGGSWGWDIYDHPVWQGALSSTTRCLQEKKLQWWYHMEHSTTVTLSYFYLSC